jgi:hypothetical protein
MVDGVQLNPQTDLKLDKKDGKEKRTLLLSGKRSYKLARTLIYTQPLNIDPILVVDASRVALGMNIIVNIAVSDLRATFEEVGVAGDFALQHKNTQTMEWDTRSALLPNQGFVIVMTTDASVQPSGPPHPGAG